MNRSSRFLLIILSLFSCCAVLTAQPSDDIRSVADTIQFIENTTVLFGGTEGRIAYETCAGQRIASANVLPTFRYIVHECPSDIYFEIGGVRCNQSNIRLRDWINGEILEDVGMSSSWLTEPFQVNIGDTLSFYRELIGRSSQSNARRAGYVFQDTLSFSIELVDVEHDQRIALIDSLVIFAVNESGIAAYSGNYPILFAPRFIAEPEHVDRKIAIRVIPIRTSHSNTTGNVIGIARKGNRILSGYSKPTHEPWSDYVKWTGGSTRVVAPSVLDSISSKSAVDLVVEVDSLSRSLDILVRPYNKARISVVVYNEQGEAIASPLFAPTMDNYLNVRTVVDKLGSYYIGLYYGQKLVSVERVSF